MNNRNRSKSGLRLGVSTFIEEFEKQNISFGNVRLEHLYKKVPGVKEFRQRLGKSDFFSVIRFIDDPSDKDDDDAEYMGITYCKIYIEGTINGKKKRFRYGDLLPFDHILPDSLDDLSLSDFETIGDALEKASIDLALRFLHPF